MNKKFDLFRNKEKEKLLKNKEELENIINEKNTTKIKFIALVFYLVYAILIIGKTLPNLMFNKIDTIVVIMFLMLSVYGWNRGNKYALIGIIFLTLNFIKYISLEYYFFNMIISIITIIATFNFFSQISYEGISHNESIKEVKNKKYYFLYFLLLPFTSYGFRTMFFEAYPFAEYILIFLLGGFCAAMFDIGSMRELKRKIRKINKRESNDKI